MSDFTDRTVKEYLNALSDRAIIPGGGSAASLAGALGAALNLMVIRLAAERKNTAGTDRTALKELESRQQEILDRLTVLVDEDCRGFERLMARIRGKEVVEDDYKEAAGVPLEICRLCAGSADISSAIADKAGKALLSDVLCAVNFLGTAFTSAAVNVDENIRHVTDEKFVLKQKEELRELSGSMDVKKNDVMEQVKN